MRGSLSSFAASSAAALDGSTSARSAQPSLGLRDRLLGDDDDVTAG